MSEKSKIAIQKVKNDDVKSAVFSSLELIGAKKLITKSGMKFLLKPNILMGKPPERAVTTHPEVLRAVIQWLKQFNPTKIYVCESSGGQQVGATERAMKGSGLKDVCDSEGVECIPFEKTERVVYKVKNPLVLDEVASSKLFEEVDLIINLPKIKTHGQCTMTCCIKNMFGTLLLSNKARDHAKFPRLEDFGASLADIYSISNPQLTVIDGYLCQEGNGPSGGDVVKLDLIMAGYDPIALDTAVCKIIGVPVEKVLYIQKGEERGLGTSDLAKVEVVGETIDGVFRQFKLPKGGGFSAKLPKWLTNYVSKKIFKANLKFSVDKCKLCATCWTNCPVKAIKPPEDLKKGNIPTWDSKKCITCYCCAELCPHEAVEFKIDYLKNALHSWIIVVVLGIIALLIWLIYAIFDIFF
jgi:uncharacterized protein (DUF362 family)/Pyruvate/2-oxoacid:ferredoxin oxidoreductase delta subunit